MQFEHTSALRRRTLGRRPWLIATAGAALLTIAGLGVWQTAVHDGGSTATLVQPSSAGRTPARVKPRTFGAGSATMSTVYLVGSIVEASTVQAAIDERDHIRTQFGKPVAASMVVVASSPEEEATVSQAVTDLTAIRAAMGGPPPTIVDLRSR